MQDRKQRGPFLEEDIDHLIGDKSRRSFALCRRGFGGRGRRSIRLENGSRLKAAARLAALLDFFFEGICFS